MRGDNEHVWVFVEFLRGDQTMSYLGRMSGADLVAIATGQYLLPFVLLEHAHWKQPRVDGNTGKQVTDTIAFGHPGSWEHFEGPVYLRPQSIVTIAPLRDGYGKQFRKEMGW